MQDLVPLLSSKTDISKLKSGSVDSAGSPGFSENLSDAPSSISFHEVMVEQGRPEGLKSGFDAIDLANGKLQNLSSGLKDLLNDPEALTALSSESPLFEQLQSFLEGNDFSDLFSDQGGNLPPSLESIQQSLSEMLVKLSDTLSSELPDSAASIDVLEQVRSLLSLSQGTLDLIQGKNDFTHVADAQVAQLLSAKPVSSGAISSNVSSEHVSSENVSSENVNSENVNSENRGKASIGAYLKWGEQTVANPSQATKDSINHDIPKPAIVSPLESEASRSVSNKEPSLLANGMYQKGSFSVSGENTQKLELLSESDVLFNSKIDLGSSAKSEFSTLLDAILPDKGEAPTKLVGTELQSRSSGAGLKQYSTMVGTNVGDAEWSEDVNQKIVWLTGRNIQSADIHLNPAELGPIDVKISIHNDAASITINSQNASVRELLESNVHRLRDMMESNGVDVLDVNVDSGGQEQSYASQNQDGNGGSKSEDDITDPSQDPEIQKIESSVSSNLVDYFA